MTRTQLRTSAAFVVVAAMTCDTGECSLEEVATTVAVGSLPGSFDVDASGRARYSIPIKVPPGRRSVQPALSVEYNSGSSESSLGVGFEVAGFSSIQRCGKTFHEDGYREGVQLDGDDALCLDGQRLVVDPGSSAGGHNTQYRTKQDVLLRVTSFADGADGISGISRFVVETPDGGSRHYGSTPNSRQSFLRDGNHIVLAWHVTETRDPDGNAIQYEYDQVTPTTSHDIDTRDPIPLVVPRGIRYTGYFDGSTTTPGTRYVEFVYLDPYLDEEAQIIDPNPEAHEGFLRGHFYFAANARRLDRIRTYAHGDLVGEMRFFGHHDADSHRWRLDKVLGCINAPPESPNDLTDGLVCTRPTQFKWRDLPEDPDRLYPTSGEPAFQYYQFDLSNRRRAYLGVCSDGVGICLERNPIVALDVNGDGADDFVYLVADDEESFRRLALRYGAYSLRAETGSSPVVPFSTGNLTSIQNHEPIDTYGAIDYDMDGRDDLMYVDQSGQLTLLRSLGNDFEVITASLPSFDPAEESDVRWQYWHHRFADIDGDGRTDLLVCQNDREAEPFTLFSEEWADLNERGTWHFALRTDTGFGPVIDSGIETNCQNEWLGWAKNPWSEHALVPGRQPGDYDGDGRAELLIAPMFYGTGDEEDSITKFRVLSFDRILGDLVAHTTDISVTPHVEMPLPIDLNGDGNHDLVGYSPDSSYQVLRTAHLNPDQRVHRVMSLGEPGQFITHESPDTHSLGPASLGHGPQRIVREVPIGPASLYEFLGLAPFDINADGRGDILVQTLPDSDYAPTSSFSTTSWPAATGWSLESRDGFASRDYPVTLELKQHVVDHNGQAVLTPRMLTLDGNGDGTLDVLHYTDATTLWGASMPVGVWYSNVRAEPSLLAEIRDGFRATTRIEWAPLSDPSVYTRGTTGCAYPIRCVSDSRHVVSAVTVEDGYEGRRFEYQYRDGKVDVRGAGWLGFAERMVSDTRTGELTRETYDNSYFDPAYNAYPRAGLVLTETHRAVTVPTPGDASLRTIGTELVHTYTIVGGTIPGTYRVEARRTDQTDHKSMGPPSGPDLLDGVPVVSQGSTVRTFDSFGNVLTEVQDIPAQGFTVSRTSTYDNLTGPWVLGRVTSHEVDTLENGCAFETNSAMTYVGSTARIQSILRDPGDPATETTTALSYDLYGNITQTEVTGATGVRRHLTSFEPEGYFPDVESNTIGYDRQVTYSPRHGGLLYEEDVNGTPTEFRYDGFGRLRQQSTLGRPSVQYSYAQHPYGEIELAITRKSETGESNTVLLDRLGRLRHTISTVTNPASVPATEVFVHTWEYHDLGHLVAVIEPRQPPFSTGAPDMMTFEYDGLGLLRATTTADGVRTEYWYEQFRSHRRDGEGHVWTSEVDSLGRLIRHTAPEPGGSARYTYCGGSALRTSQTPAGSVTTIDYDVRGRKTALHDPDRGTTRYEYSAFNEVLARIDAMGQRVEFTYDGLGRTTERRDVADGTTTRWIYDTAINTIGQPVKMALDRAEGPGGVVIDARKYDALNRLQALRREIDGEVLRVAFGYDTIGRVRQVTYDSELGPPLVVDHQYHPVTGALTSIDVDGDPVWRLDHTSKYGVPDVVGYRHGLVQRRLYTPGGLLERVTVDGFVDGAFLVAEDVEYLYNARGLVERRENHVAGRSDKYTYDPLRRLVNVESTDPAFDQSFGYNIDGNMTYASDVGVLQYPAPTSPRPHATISAGGTPYVYDAIGNLRQRGDTTLEYNQFNLPVEVYDPGSGMRFYAYGAEGDRAMTDDDSGRRVELPGLMERKQGPTGQEEVFYLNGPLGRFLQIERHESAEAGSDVSMGTYRYLHRDGLDSVVGTTTLDGTVDYAGYGAFGKQITSGLVGPVRHGFTGHEHDPDDLVNMRGRIFDLRSRRFATPDPLVTSLRGQRLNRYSYVMNNPVSANDPSGFFGPNDPVPEGFTRECNGDACTLIGPEFFIIGRTDGAAAERAGGRESGQDTNNNLGTSLSSPSSAPRSSLTNFVFGDEIRDILSRPRPEREPMTNADWVAMWERAEPTMQATDFVAKTGMVLGGVGALAGVAAPAAIGLYGELAPSAVGLASRAPYLYAEAGRHMFVYGIRHRWAGLLMSMGTTAVEALDDGAVPGVSSPVVGALASSARPVVQSSAAARRVRWGQSGEDLVRAVEDIGEKVTFELLPRGPGGPTRVRIPDGVTDTVLTEVKFVLSLSFTKQLRDYLDIADATGRTTFDLWVHRSTELSEPLLEAIFDDELIRIRYIPDP